MASTVALICKIILLFFSFRVSTGEKITSTIDQCSSLGSSIATRDNHCSGVATSAPIRGVPPEMQSVCLSAMQLSCVHDLRTIECEQGKQVAKSGGNCPEGDPDRKLCCEACKLGMISASMSVDCNNPTINFGCPWNLAYETCCSSSYSEPTETIKNITDNIDPMINTGPEQNICEMYPGELCTQICKPNLGSYLCQCYDNFTLMEDGKTCQQKIVQDRCTTNNPCQQICRDTGVSVECSCETGYRLHSNNKSCFDIDECAEKTQFCMPDETCINEPGTFRCEANEESTTKTDSTTISNWPLQRPVASEICSFGYQIDWKTNRCVDINECDEADSPCDSNQICENTPGSYRCRCKSGYQLDSLTRACVDINECQVDLHNCLPSQRCDNTIGSFQCVRYTNCGTGYTLNAQTGLCEDDDECLLNIDNCRYIGPDFVCRNIQGSFRCEKKQKDDCSAFGKCGIPPPPVANILCPRGFEVGPSGQCEDVDECRTGKARCPHNHRCVNIKGAYTCVFQITCENGLRMNEAKTACTDIDECSEQKRICDHICVNSWSSYRCSCLPGYKLHEDNRTCVDLNECELFKDRQLCTGYCVNQPGSYSCQCPQGYVLGQDGASCQDIDECKTGTVCTNQDETCLNMRGSYRCNSLTCPTGYVKDLQHKNRCKKPTNVCREDDIECFQQPMMYSFYFITLVSNYTIPQDGLDLFAMSGPARSSTTVDFNLDMKTAQAPPGIPAATHDYFILSKSGYNQVKLKLYKPLIGPQDIHLDVTMTFYHNNIYSGKTISKLGVFVSQYTF